MKRLIWDACWPSGIGEDPLTVATRRLLSVFLIITGLGLLGVSAVYYQKNFSNYPLHSIGTLALAVACLLLPFWTARTANPRRAALVIVIIFFACVTALGSWIDGLISVKALAMLPMVVAVTLIFGWQAGLISSLLAVAVFVAWHVFRHSIGGNLSMPMSTSDLSAMLLVGLSFALLLLFAGTSIYRQQLLKIVKLLADARREAELASRAKSVLLANVSHELRNPMSGITGLASTLLRTPLNAEQRSSVEHIRQSGEALDRLLNDLLDYAAMQSGRLKIRREPVDLGQVMDRVISPFSVAAAAKGIEFLVRIDSTVQGRFRGDPVRIGQVVSNLVSNAVKFTATGSVSVIAKVEPAADNSSAGMFCVSIVDTGPGIPLEAQQRVFEAFEQADPGTSARLSGVGLGLSMCRELVDRMGGSIELVSQPNLGSTFVVRIPMLPATATAGSSLQGAMSEPEAGRSGKRILVIEDSAAHQHIMGAILQEFGIEAAFADHGAEGIRRAVGDEFDAALVDLNLPDMDGVSVCRAIVDQRATRGLRRMPTLIVTSDGTIARMTEADRGGADGFLTKPVSPESLFRHLASVLD
jgi:signal transduction histidine kinase/ActR/RegA family two-component response regulator